MKILNSLQIKVLDKQAIDKEKITSLELMEKAAYSFVEWFMDKFTYKNPIHIFCGKYNNGGDGLAIARMLLDQRYIVYVHVVNHTEKCSEDFKQNLEALSDRIKVNYINSSADIPVILPHSIIVDAILGSGLSRPLLGVLEDVVIHLNKQMNTTIAVDIATGLYTDAYNPSTSILEVDYTVSFQVPKLSFFLAHNYKYVGKWVCVDIGLDNKYLDSIDTEYYYVDLPIINSMLKAREKFTHKGSFGHTLLIAGSCGKIGAAILAAKASLRTGTGLVTTHLPKCGFLAMQAALPECIVSIDKTEEHLSSWPKISEYNSIAIGPGLGMAADTLEGFRKIMKSLVKPTIFDADAINILGAYPELMLNVPENSMFTPHPKEFERLVGTVSNGYERLEKQLEFCEKYKVYVAFKGAHTTVCTPDGKFYFNSTGNPGMATAGSGDVLTGIIAALIAQDYTPEEAMVLGVFLHGKAGDLAVEEHSQESLMASDIISHIGKAYNDIRESLNFDE